MASAWSIVARSEYGEGARSRWFVISTLLGPLLMGGLIVGSAYLQVRGSGKSMHVALVDESQPAVGPLVEATLAAVRLGEGPRFLVEPATGPAAAPAALQQRVDQGALDGWLVLPRDVANGGTAVYRGTNASSQVDMAILDKTLDAAVMEARARSLGLRPDQAIALLAPVSFSSRQATGQGNGASGGAAFIIAELIGFLLYIGIVLYAINVMRSVIQEKTNRMIEVVVACARPFDLMLGKVLGVGGLGLTQMSIWVAAGLVVAHERVPILRHFGIRDVGALALPSLGVGSIGEIAFFFLGGYFLYATIFAAVGAANNSDREAQQAQMPIMMPLLGAMLCIPVVTASPRDTAAVALTLIPLVSPILMPMRAMLTPVPLWQTALSVALLLLTILVVVWAAARIYRVGILMYGKKPTVGELLRWIRRS